ncbi:MAG: MFS transporter [Rhodocyclaceae bacterium]|nr:MFS transporter [Rhodocyclaceae bacterium]MBX3668864.1 MFS transporter [Rhodocyclaceae bacterium]
MSTAAPLFRLSRLAALLLAAQMGALVLLTYMLLNKHRELLIDLAVSRAAIAVDSVRGVVAGGYAAGLTLPELDAVGNLLPRLARAEDVRGVGVISIDRDGAHVLWSAGEFPASSIPPDWLRQTRRSAGVWSSSSGPLGIVMGRRLSDSNDEVVGACVMLIADTGIARQSDAARRSMLPVLGGAMLGACILLPLMLSGAARLRRGRLSTRLLVAALIAACVGSAGVSLLAVRQFTAHIEPAVNAKAETLAQFVSGQVDRALGLGIPFEGLTGVEAYFRDLLAQHPEVVQLRLEAPGGGRSYVLARDSGTGIAAVAPVGAVGSVTAEMRVVADAGLVARRVWEIWTDIAVLLMVSVVVFNELVSGALIGMREAGAADVPDVLPHELARLRLAMFLLILSEELTRSFLPLTIRDLAGDLQTVAGMSAISLPISAYMLCFALATPYGGNWADRYGSRRIMFVGCALSAAGFFWGGLDAHYGSFVAARCLCAAGYALATLAAQRSIVHQTTPATRAQGLAMFLGAASAAAICGAAIGGVLAQQFGRQTVFIASAAASLAALAVASATPPVRAAQADAPLSIAALLRLVVHWRMAAIFFGAAMPNKFVLTGFLFYLVPLAMMTEGYSANDVGRAVMIYFLLNAALNPLASRLSDRYGWRAGLVALGAALVGAGGLAGWWGGAAVLYIGIAALGAGTGLMSAPLQALAVEAGRESGAPGASSVMAALRTVERLGAMLGPLVLGALNSRLDYDMVMVVTGAGVLACLVLFSVAQGRTRAAEGCTP